jgi:hypothetical protein
LISAGFHLNILAPDVIFSHAPFSPADTQVMLGKISNYYHIFYFLSKKKKVFSTLTQNV